MSIGSNHARINNPPRLSRSRCHCDCLTSRVPFLALPHLPVHRCHRAVLPSLLPESRNDPRFWVQSNGNSDRVHTIQAVRSSILGIFHCSSSLSHLRKLPLRKYRSEVVLDKDWNVENLSLLDYVLCPVSDILVALVIGIGCYLSYDYPVERGEP